MKKRLLVYPISFVILIGLTVFTCGSKKAITYDGGSISIDEVDEKSKAQMYQVRKQEFDIRKNIAFNIVFEKLLEIEGKILKKEPSTLIDEYINQKYVPVSEQQMLDYYEQNKSRIGRSFQEVRQELVEGFADHQKEQLKQEYKNSLSAKYKVELLLEEPIQPKISVDVDDDPFWGVASAKVVVVEFSDFECPYCQRMQNDIKRIRQEYAGKIKWVFRDFPLPFHKRSMKAHIGANCAGRQKKYFEFHNAVFDSFPNINPENLIGIAQKIGLDMNQFQICLADKDGIEAREIQKDINYGQSIGVNGTPSLFIDGEFQNGVRPYENLKTLIDKALK